VPTPLTHNCVVERAAADISLSEVPTFPFEVIHSMPANELRSIRRRPSDFDFKNPRQPPLGLTALFADGPCQIGRSDSA